MELLFSVIHESHCLTKRLEYTFAVDCGFSAKSALYSWPSGVARPVITSAMVSESKAFSFRLETGPLNVAIVFGLKVVSTCDSRTGEVVLGFQVIDIP